MITEIFAILAWAYSLCIMVLFRGIYELYPKKKDVKGGE